jgi:hypothetical protein
MAWRLLVPYAMAYRSALRTSCLAVASSLLLLACGGTGAVDSADSGSGGQTGSGGTASGGASSGGAATGGAATGGGTATGGSPGSGGESATGGSPGSGGNSSAECPSAAPADATMACAGPRPSCFYEDCTGAGQVTATCDGEVYQTETVACEEFSCGGETCAAGQICAINAGGALIGTCMDNPCGDGAVTCACARPDCGGSCFVSGASGSGIEVTCNTCPSGLACP